MEDLKQFRCEHCTRLLFKGKFVGIIEVKCPHCRQFVTFEIKKETLKSS